jgi:hypothetical protein
MKNKTTTLSLTFVAAATVAGLAAPAFAQETTPPPASAPAPEIKRTGRTSGDIASGGLGVGATAFVSGLAGPEVVYDFGAWHLDGMIGFQSTPFPNPNSDRATIFQFGVGGWYHLHIGENSDFSVGGAFGLVNVSPPGPANSTTGFEFEPGVQVRAFITPNVALHGGTALVFEFGDVTGGVGGNIGLGGGLNKTIGLGANITANLGFTYYFR